MQQGLIITLAILTALLIGVVVFIVKDITEPRKDAPIKQAEMMQLVHFQYWLVDNYASLPIGNKEMTRRATEYLETLNK